VEKERAVPAGELVVNRVRSSTTETAGRSVSRVRSHQLVIDEPVHAGGPGEKITPAEAFLAGVSACGVLLVEGKARETNVRLDHLTVDIEAVRHRSDTSVFHRIDMVFRLSGPTQAQAVELVKHYQTH
jgi:uncharacterized OsmC-like protein